MWRAAVTGQFTGASILQQGFPSELHIRRLFKKYDNNLHKSDLRVRMLHTLYSVMPTGERPQKCCAEKLWLGFLL